MLIEPHPNLILIMVCICLNLYYVQANNSVVGSSNNNESYMPFTIRGSQMYEGQRTCGYRDRNLYMNNGTFEEIGFYSKEKFSLFVQADSANISITGFAIAREISQASLRQLLGRQHKVYRIQRYKLKVVDEGSLEISNKAQQKVDIQNESGKWYYANLAVYGICRTASISTMSKNLEVRVTYQQEMGEHQSVTNSLSSTSIQQQSQQQQSQQTPDPNSVTAQLHTQTVTIPTVVYCIDGVSIQQANFFVSKIYYLFVLSLIALLLNFKPLKHLHIVLRTTGLIAYVTASLYADTLYFALITTYAGITLLVIFYRYFEERTVFLLLYKRQTLISKTYILVSFASALPLAIKSHLDDESVQQKKFLLYLINFIMICNTILFVSSMVNLKRFRHAFYYFLLLALTEHYFSSYVQNVLAFSILEFQIFPVPYHCESLFFMFWTVPLCDFFFKSYSSESLYKFVILLVPLLVKPLAMSYSLSFALGLMVWIINGRLNGHDMIKIIKYKK